MLLFLTLFILYTTAEETYENSTSICQKCTCTHSTDYQIFTMNCVDKNIHHILDSWPDSNATIISATFARNNITTLQTLPSTDAQLEISLSKCNIQFLYPGLFDGTKNVKVVDLSYNQLTADEISQEKFMGPYHHTKMEPIKLENLDLAYNQIHTLNKNVFDYLPNLKWLNLEGNDFKVLDVHTQLALSSLRNLVGLNLANNELTELVENAIESYRKLIELDLSRNKLDFVPYSLIKVADSLEILTLDYNPIIELAPESFTGLTNLVEISANNLSKLRRIESKTFVELRNLQKLHLSNNHRLEIIDEEAFNPNCTLLELYLNDNNLSTIPHKLLSWSHLHVFEFKDNPLKCSCDLYNITGALSREITAEQDAPYCVDPRTGRPVPVFSLKSDICGAKAVYVVRRRRSIHLSIPLAGLIAVLILATCVAVSLAYSRYRRFIRNRNYPFASQVLYNPLNRF